MNHQNGYLKVLAQYTRKIHSNIHIQTMFMANSRHKKQIFYLQNIYSYM